MKSIWQKIKSDVPAASYPTMYNLSTERGRELDSMSIIDWIEESVPGRDRRGSVRCSTSRTTSSTALSASDQSSLNLLYLLGYRGQGQLRLFGPSNEKYHVVGGNDRITDGLVSVLAGQIMTGSELVTMRATRRHLHAHVRAASDGRPSPRIRSCSRCRSPSCDRRSTSRGRLRAAKMPAIREQGMGTNSKLNVQFSTASGARAGTGRRSRTRATRTRGRSRVPNPARAGILVDYTGGMIGASFGSGTPASRAAKFLGQLEPVLPGATKAGTARRRSTSGPATADKGSYSYWKVGQYQRFAGMEGGARATASSPVNTRRSTSRATSTAPWKPDSERLRRSSATSSRDRPRSASLTAQTPSRLNGIGALLARAHLGRDVR